jgi:hypothetical protein
VLDAEESDVRSYSVAVLAIDIEGNEIDHNGTFAKGRVQRW